MGAAHALSLLAMLGLLRVAYGLFYDAMAAVGRRNTLMAIQGLWLVTLIPVLLVGARLRGITGVSRRPRGRRRRAGRPGVPVGAVPGRHPGGLDGPGLPARRPSAAC